MSASQKKTASNEKSANNSDDLIQRIGEYIKHIVDLKPGTDQKGTIDSIQSYIEVRGYNAWILVSAAMIAAIGLDNNAPAIIIGAMLISPLMSPILGVGLAVGINDRQMFRDSIQNFFIAIVISVLTSYVYFLLTPLGNPTHEILSRTSPTVLDALVALFGGIAGIVAGSREDKTNAIPGVAIATALMPPLCTVGFGLAKGRLDIWLGAGYLFFINAVIIVFSTYLIVKYLNFPLKKHQNKRDRRKTTIIMVAFAILVTIPSFFILIQTLERIATNRGIQNFVDNELTNNTLDAVDWKITKRDSIGDITELSVYLVGKSLKEDTIPYLEKSLQKKPNLHKANLHLIQADVSQEERKRISNQISSEVNRISLEINKQLQAQKIELEQIIQLQQKARNLQSDPEVLIALRKELAALYPEITDLNAAITLSPIAATIDTLTTKIDSLAIDSVYTTQIPASMKEMYMLSIKWKEAKNTEALAEREQRIYRYVKLRLGLDTLLLNRN